MTAQMSDSRRRGFVLPMVALWIVVLFCFIALAVDLGLVALARTQCQNAADAAAINGARALNGDNATNNNFSNVATAARATAARNAVLARTIVDGQVTIRIGSYEYVPDATYPDDPTKAKFQDQNMIASTVTPTTGVNYSAVEATVTSDDPSVSTDDRKYAFAQIFNMLPGVSMPTTFTVTAKAKAVHRPRDIGISVDFSGSMGKDTAWGWNAHRYGTPLSRLATNCLNSSVVPQFGHYSVSTPSSAPLSMQNTTYSYDNLIRTVNNNDPCIEDFYSHNVISETATTGKTKAFLPLKMADTPLNTAIAGDNPPAGMAMSVTPNSTITSSSGTDRESVAFASDPGWPTGTKVRVNTGGNGLAAGTDHFVRRAGGSPMRFQFYSSRTNATAAGTPPTTGLRDLTGTINFAIINADAAGSFAKNVNEATGGNTANLSSTNPYTTSGGSSFKGYTRGPGYYGITFWIWPANLTGTTDAQRNARDWRRRFFRTDLYTSTAAPVNDNSRLWEAGSGTGNDSGDNGTAGQWRAPVVTGTTATTSYIIDYDAIMEWIAATETTEVAASRAKVLPDQLRCGRFMYYDRKPLVSGTPSLSINQNLKGGVLHAFEPTWVKLWENSAMTATSVSGFSSTGTSQSISPQNMLNMRFWKEYIDYVIGVRQTGQSGSGSTYTATYVRARDDNDEARRLMHGLEFGWSNGTHPVQISSGAVNGPADNPHDNPDRPKLNFWFGPLSMVDFCTNVLNFKFGDDLGGDWPGNLHQGDMWYAKAAVEGAITNIQNSHPNDYLTMSFYSNPNATTTYNGADRGRFNRIRAPLGRSYNLLRGACWYPLDAMVGSNDTANWGNVSVYNVASTTETPYARGATTFGHALQLLHNQFSSNTTSQLKTWASDTTTTSLPGNTAAGDTSFPVGEAGGLGRRGAQKVVIFETDGICNKTVSVGTDQWDAGSSNSTSFWKIRSGKVGTARNELVNTVTDSGEDGGDTQCRDNVMAIVNKMCALESAGGFALPRRPVLIHCIQFGNQDNGTAFTSTHREILRYMQTAGRTQAQTSDDLVSNKIINQSTPALRKTALENAFNVIMNDGIQLALIE